MGKHTNIQALYKWLGCANCAALHIFWHSAAQINAIRSFGGIGIWGIFEGILGIFEGSREILGVLKSTCRGREEREGL
jgi:hypothetical protein